MIEKGKIEEIKKLLTENFTSSIRFIQSKTNLSFWKVRSILLYELKLKKLYLRWIPSDLTEDLKKKRLLYCIENLKIFQNKKSLISSIVTGDESWFFFIK